MANDLLPPWAVPFVDANTLLMRQEWRWFFIALVSAASSAVGGLDTMSANQSGALVPDVSVGLTHSITLGADVSLAAPVNFGPGSLMLIRLVQDDTGGHAVVFDAFYRGLSAFALNTAAKTAAGLFFQVDADGTAADLLLVAMNGSPIA